jgi:hypothetical protein
MRSCLLVAGVVAALGCGSARDRAALTAESDVRSLETFIRWPAELTTARWVIAPRVPPGRLDLGPTDQILTIWVPISPAVAARVLGPARPAATCSVPRATAEAVLPPAIIAGLPRHGDDVEIAGPGHDLAVLEGRYHAGCAVEVDGGVVLTFFTM